MSNEIAITGILIALTLVALVVLLVPRGRKKDQNVQTLPPIYLNLGVSSLDHQDYIVTLEIELIIAHKEYFKSVRNSYQTKIEYIVTDSISRAFSIRRSEALNRSSTPRATMSFIESECNQRLEALGLTIAFTHFTFARE